MLKDIFKLLIIFVFGLIAGFYSAPGVDAKIEGTTGIQQQVSNESYGCNIGKLGSSDIPTVSAEDKLIASRPESGHSVVSTGSQGPDNSQSDRFMQFATIRLIDDISKYTQLSEQQKNEIREKGGQIAREFWAADRNSETLKQILGELEYRKYNEVLSLQRIKFQQDNIEKEVLFYGRKLKLNESQENDLRSAFAQAQAQASEMAHNSESGARDPASFQKRREQIRNSVIEQMQNGLSAEQLQQLQQEMEAGERFWGRW